MKWQNTISQYFSYHTCALMWVTPGKNEKSDGNEGGCKGLLHQLDPNKCISELHRLQLVDINENKSSSGL